MRIKTKSQTLQYSLSEREMSRMVPLSVTRRMINPYWFGEVEHIWKNRSQIKEFVLMPPLRHRQTHIKKMQSSYWVYNPPSGKQWLSLEWQLCHSDFPQYPIMHCLNESVVYLRLEFQNLISGSSGILNYCLGLALRACNFYLSHDVWQ